MLPPPAGIQSPIPLIYLDAPPDLHERGWDSVTYPLDILAARRPRRQDPLGFSHLSP